MINLEKPEQATVDGRTANQLRCSNALLERSARTRAWFCKMATGQYVNHGSGLQAETCLWPEGRSRTCDSRSPLEDEKRHSRFM
ncbi:hypothetical protein R1flu_001525 [Riccia fluitans]|uniref:Uncharacterized protein n=1 Tax=Riccia fluitans TaxID=41844 RepID=A0ABD1Y3Z7_9MARC